MQHSPCCAAGPPPVCSKSDPMVVLLAGDSQQRTWSEVDRSEVVANCLSECGFRDAEEQPAALQRAPASLSRAFTSSLSLSPSPLLQIPSSHARCAATLTLSGCSRCDWLSMMWMSRNRTQPGWCSASKTSWVRRRCCLAAMALAILHLTLPSINTAYSAWPASLTLHRPTLLPLCLPASS